MRLVSVLALVYCTFAAVSAQENVVDLTKTMVNIESTSGNEKPMSDFLVSWLTHRNFTIERQVLAANRENILIYRGSYRSTRLLFNTHLDTVPPYISASESSTQLFGRGSTDAKASIAAQLFAMLDLWSTGSISESDVSFLFVVGEEVDHFGMKNANQLGLNPEYLIVGEPTESKLALGHKGLYKFRLESYGVAAHSGYPELGKSAIVPLLEVLLDLNNLALPSDPLLGPTTLNIGTINGGVAGNVVPDFAQAEVVVRVATTVAQVKSLIVNTIRNRVTLIELTENEPVTCGTVPGFEYDVMAYGTDIPYFEGSHESYLFGPGSIKVAHSNDEAISKAELQNSVHLYKQLALSILAQKKN